MTSKGLDRETDTATLHRLGSYLYDELQRTPWWQIRRTAKLDAAFHVTHAILSELEVRDQLRCPTMFTPADDPAATPVRGSTPLSVVAAL